MEDNHTLKMKQMGRTGLKVTEICLGTMTFGNQCDQPTAFGILDRAWAAGINFIDTADAYPLGGGLPLVGSTETIIGNWFSAHPGRRHETVLATKCFGQMSAAPNDQGLSRRHILDAVEGSLRRLQTDFIDLYQVHNYDASTPQEETLRALDDLVKAGKVRYAGCSNHRASQLAKALWISDKHGLARYECIQPRYNLLFREFESDLLPFCQDEGVGVIAYNPLAGGFLSGKHRREAPPEAGGRFTLGQAGKMYQARYWQEAQFDAVDRLKAFFSAREKPLIQVALAWVLAQKPITSAILGASRPEQLDETLPGVDLSLDAEEMAFINNIWFDLPRSSDPNIAFR